MSEKERTLFISGETIKELLLAQAAEITEAGDFPFQIVMRNAYSEGAVDVRFFADRESYYRALLAYALLELRGDPDGRALASEIRKALDD